MAELLPGPGRLWTEVQLQEFVFSKKAPTGVCVAFFSYIGCRFQHGPFYFCMYGYVSFGWFSVGGYRRYRGG